MGRIDGATGWGEGAARLLTLMLGSCAGSSLAAALLLGGMEAFQGRNPLPLMALAFGMAGLVFPLALGLWGLPSALVFLLVHRLCPWPKAAAPLAGLAMAAASLAPLWWAFAPLDGLTLAAWAPLLVVTPTLAHRIWR